MRVLKSIFIGFGMVCALIVTLLTWPMVSSTHFRKEQAPFVEKFVADLSMHWDFADVRDRMSNRFIEQAGTPQAQQLLQQFKHLGSLRSAQNFKLLNYVNNNNGQMGDLSFTGTFANGEALVDVIIVRNDGAVRAIGFYLKTIHLRNVGSKFEA